MDTKTTKHPTTPTQPEVSLTNSDLAATDEVQEEAEVEMFLDKSSLPSLEKLKNLLDTD